MRQKDSPNSCGMSCFGSLFRKKPSRSGKGKNSLGRSKIIRAASKSLLGSKNKSGSSKKPRGSTQMGSTNGVVQKSDDVAEKCVTMTELQKKILSFREWLDLPPCTGSSTIIELVKDTVKELHKLHPDVVHCGSEPDSGSMHKAINELCESIKSLGKHWMHSDEWMARSKKDDVANGDSEKHALALLDDIINVARERAFNKMDTDDDKEVKQDTDSPSSSYEKSYSLQVRTSPSRTPTSVLPQFPNNKSAKMDPHVAHQVEKSDDEMNNKEQVKRESGADEGDECQAGGKDGLVTAQMEISVPPSLLKSIADAGNVLIPAAGSPSSSSKQSSVSAAIISPPQQLVNSEESQSRPPQSGRKSDILPPPLPPPPPPPCLSGGESDIATPVPPTPPPQPEMITSDTMSLSAPPPPPVPLPQSSSPPPPPPPMVSGDTNPVVPGSSLPPPPPAPPFMVSSDGSVPTPPAPVTTSNEATTSPHLPPPPPPPPMSPGSPSPPPAPPAPESIPPPSSSKVSSDEPVPPPPPPPMAPGSPSPPESIPLPPAPPPSMVSPDGSAPPPPPDLTTNNAAKSSSALPPLPPSAPGNGMPGSLGSIPPPAPMAPGNIPPPPLPSKGSVPAPPPPGQQGKGGAPPPPPAFGGSGKMLRKSVSKLKRSSQMGCLYRQLKAKVEGSTSKGKSSQKKGTKVAASGGNGKQGMADALAEITKRSSYFQQIEEDVKNYSDSIKEVKSALVSFQTTDMKELIKFHKYVESHLEKLTDETQVLARFEDFPGKKLEGLRMAAALYSKLDAIASDLQNWKVVSPVNDTLDRVENYFNKIKEDIDALDRTKDDEIKKFKSQNIHFDFGILIRIKEAMVDVSSSCMELALKEKKEASSSKKNKKANPGKILWKAFQFAFRVYSFAGGQDERADNLTREIAQQLQDETLQ